MKRAILMLGVLFYLEGGGRLWFPNYDSYYIGKEFTWLESPKVKSKFREPAVSNKSILFITVQDKCPECTLDDVVVNDR